jgi:hypothetical protein
LEKLLKRLCWRNRISRWRREIWGAHWSEKVIVCLSPKGEFPDILNPSRIRSWQSFFLQSFDEFWRIKQIVPVNWMKSMKKLSGGISVESFDSSFWSTWYCFFNCKSFWALCEVWLCFYSSRSRKDRSGLRKQFEMCESVSILTAWESFSSEIALSTFSERRYWSVSWWSSFRCERRGFHRTQSFQEP